MLPFMYSSLFWCWICALWRVGPLAHSQSRGRAASVRLQRGCIEQVLLVSDAFYSPASHLEDAALMGILLGSHIWGGGGGAMLALQRDFLGRKSNNNSGHC